MPPSTSGSVIVCVSLVAIAPSEITVVRILHGLPSLLRKSSANIASICIDCRLAVIPQLATELLPGCAPQWPQWDRQKLKSNRPTRRNCTTTYVHPVMIRLPTKTLFNRAVRNPHASQRNYLHLAGRRTAFSICYEDFLWWPHWRRLVPGPMSSSGCLTAGSVLISH